ncbi:MAG: hypothetical protein ACK4MI_03835 [Brevundimonas sp.]|uniref:hypothetical protein n=1 Tax=Brevundimonas sp. TaxID=1871086 RepID=UPI00391BCAF0
MATAKGDVRLGNYTLRMDFNALCDAEEDFPAIMQGQLNLDTFRNIRTMIRHALSAHHAGLSDREVGAIIQDVGMAKAAEAVGEAMRASFPAEAGETENPQKTPA